jgi:hypothetical protein
MNTLEKRPWQSGINFPPILRKSADDFAAQAELAQPLLRAKTTKAEG